MLKQKLYARFDCFLDDPRDPEPRFDVVSVDVTEALSTPYEIKVRLVSELLNLTPKAFIRRLGRIILNFGHHKRHFHGVIGMFKQLHMITTSDGNTVCFYEAFLYPQLWFLKFNQDYRIFQELTTLDIVTKLLEENKVLHVSFPKFHRTSALNHVDLIRDYCVQYGESDFNFISRLLEDRGFYYYFEHHAKKHELKLAFTHHDHKHCPVVHEIEIRETDFKGNELNKILTYETCSKVLPQHHVLMDYDYQQASLEMVSHMHSSGDGGVVYDYPAGFNTMQDGHLKTKQCVEGDETQTLIFSGTSAAPFFSPGFKFKLLGHPNPLFDERTFTLETVTHKVVDPRFAGEDDMLYQNQFTAFLSNQPYRPQKKTPKPKIHGTQTAVVVAPDGEEVWTDEQGRVKVQFHWNHRGYKPPVVVHSNHHSKHHGHHHEHHHKHHGHHHSDYNEGNHKHKHHAHHKHHHHDRHDDEMLTYEDE